MFVYADNAATTAVSKKVVDAMLPYFTEVYGNPSSLYSVGQKAKEVLEESREKVAAILGAKPREIYFTSGGSEADNQAIMSAAKAGAKKGKKHIISSKFEHHAVLHTLQALEKEGFEITLVDVHENGVVDPKEIEDAIREDTALVTIMYANNEIGTIQPIAEIGKICREKKVWFHTDAVQAISHVHINVEEQNIDMLSISAHKFHGPKGVGVLYVKGGIPVSNVIYGGAQERGKRAGTENLAGIVGLTVALEDAVANIDANNEHLAPLQERLIQGLSQIPYSELNGDRHARVTSNVNFCFEGIEGESLLLLLDDKGVAVSSGSACTSGSLDPSHVLLAIGRPHEVAHGSLRISLGEDATEEQVDYIIKSVSEVIEYLRSFSPFWGDLISGKRNHVFAEHKEIA
ncbi:cysteine desulfurase [Pseudobutyrivibrio sp. C4]|uniref:cysteine desulfurase NifS n=1 Tax=Pseudobutyrivibrio sp. C4 TaxID=1520803 RepID=UPI0008D888A2|nr:cysteine desulfurase NifS [Pseudobutyrivibrio sp. C4]SES78908.1 cysteine desulfurase [Pseudobutyrivibrio sp. C4]